MSKRLQRAENSRKYFEDSNKRLSTGGAPEITPGKKYIARICSYTMIGMQESEFQGKKSLKPAFIVGFEFKDDSGTSKVLHAPKINLSDSPRGLNMKLLRTLDPLKDSNSLLDEVFKQKLYKIRFMVQTWQEKTTMSMYDRDVGYLIEPALVENDDGFEVPRYATEMKWSVPLSVYYGPDSPPVVTTDEDHVAQFKDWTAGEKPHYVLERIRSSPCWQKTRLYNLVVSAGLEKPVTQASM